MALSSSAVSAGDKAKATQYNNLRADVTSHTHDGADTARIPAVDTGWSEIYSAGTKLAWAYASADDPTFTFTIAGDWTGSLSAGMKVKLTQTTVKYFIITKVAYSNPNTTVTVYGGTDYNLTNAAISVHCFSSAKAPQGFPLDPDKWTIEVTAKAMTAQASPTGGQWYNTGSHSINIPIGCWGVSWRAPVYQYTSGGLAAIAMFGTLSTANNSESDSDFTDGTNFGSTSSYIKYDMTTKGAEKILNLTTKDTYYLNIKTTGAGIGYLRIGDATVPLFIRAICAFL